MLHALGAPLVGAVRIDGTSYIIDEFGVVHQDPPVVMERYDCDYVRTRYDSIPDKVREMSFLRIGWLVGAVKSFTSILDVGYGNGDFLRTLGLWSDWKLARYGFDVSGYPLPDGCESADSLRADVDVACFFDSLEHIPDLDEALSSLRANWIAVTAPWRPALTAFGSWRHRRPGEHLHHFTPDSLARLMASKGYEAVIYRETLENALRPPQAGEERNTFTALYRRVQVNRARIIPCPIQRSEVAIYA